MESTRFFIGRISSQEFELSIIELILINFKLNVNLVEFFQRNKHPQENIFYIANSCWNKALLRPKNTLSWLRILNFLNKVSTYIQIGVITTEGVINLCANANEEALHLVFWFLQLVQTLLWKFSSLLKQRQLFWVEFFPLETRSQKNQYFRHEKDRPKILRRQNIRLFVRCKHQHSRYLQFKFNSRIRIKGDYEGET